MSDPFATLTWNTHLEWWTTVAEFSQGHPIELHVQAPHVTTGLLVAIERAQPMWDRLRTSELAVREAVAAQMTDAHNRYCDPLDEVTVEQFASRLRLKSVLHEARGTLELCYTAGMLLGGHWLIVPIDTNWCVGVVCEVG